MIRVLLVDDSPVVRRVLRQVIERHPDLEVVGEAGDPFAGRDLIVELKPNVVVLDIEMPRMDGLTFLRKLMKHHPLPVVICSSLTTAGGAVSIEALEAGAAEVICKPSQGYPLSSMGPDFVAAIRSAAATKAKGPPAAGVARPDPGALAYQGRADNVVIAIGSSTGGTVVVEQILKRMPRNGPGVLIVQHMPPFFTGYFANRLCQVSSIAVKEATDGMRVRPGEALVAPGDHHLCAQRTPEGLVVRVKDGPRVNGHRPSADVLFQSLAVAAGASAVGVVLTGMGNDGAKGLLAMRRAGARTLVQDEASCVVFGMPKVALELGAADIETALADLPGHLLAAAASAARAA